MDWFNSAVGQEVSGWGAFGSLAVLVVVSIVRGWLVPGRTHDRELATEKRRGDEFKEAATELRVQNNTLLETVAIIRDFFKKLPVSASTDEREKTP